MKKVLVAGASGLVGHAAIERFVALGGWEVVGVSRRVPADLAGASLLAVDLLDAAACARVFGAMEDVTHLVYAALQEDPGLFGGWIDNATIERNAAMLRNLFEPLGRASKLRHVTLLHGTKAYGIHHPAVGLRGVRIPLRERDPRIPHPNFYFVQEDYLLRERERLGFEMTVFRPTVIYGDAWGNNMNPIPPLATYAALLREAGEPLHFPGVSNEPALREAVDADLVASAISWAAEAPEARGGTFNLTNGDVFTWQGVWSAIAESMGMEPGEHRPTSLAEELPKRADEWAALVDRYGLVAPRDLVAFCGYNSLIYTDAMLGGRPPSSPLPVLNSTIAVRQAGFHDCMDSEDMFRKWFRRLAEKRLIPPPP